MYRRRYPLLLVILILAACMIGVVAILKKDRSHESPPALDHVSVVLTKNGFFPAEVTVRAHGSVTFSTDTSRPFWPAANPHPIHGIYPAFDPRAPIASGNTWSFTFDHGGDWGYHDHLRSYFEGTIHVVE